MEGSIAAETFTYAMSLEAEVDSLKNQLHDKLKKIISLEMIIEEYEENKKEKETELHRRIKSVEKRHEEDLRSYQENLNEYMESVQKQMNDWEGKLQKANMEISALNHSQQINMVVIQDLERKLQCAKNESESLKEQLQIQKLENEKSKNSSLLTPHKKLSADSKSSPVSVINDSIYNDRLHSAQRELDCLRQWAKKALEKVKFLESENKNCKIYIKKLEDTLDEKIQETVGMDDEEDVDNEKIVIIEKELRLDQTIENKKEEATNSEGEKPYKENQIEETEEKETREELENDNETEKQVIEDSKTISNDGDEKYSRADTNEVTENEDAQKDTSKEYETVISSSAELSTELKTKDENVKKIIDDEHANREKDLEVIHSDDNIADNKSATKNIEEELFVKRIDSIDVPQDTNVNENVSNVVVNKDDST